MARYIEYYEVFDLYKPGAEIEYWFMPKDKDAINKRSVDAISRRIWKLDTKTNRVECVINRDKNKNTPDLLSKLEFFKMQLDAKPLGWSDYYLAKLRVERIQSHIKDKK